MMKSIRFFLALLGVVTAHIAMSQTTSSSNMIDNRYELYTQLGFRYFNLETREIMGADTFISDFRQYPVLQAGVRFKIYNRITLSTGLVYAHADRKWDTETAQLRVSQNTYGIQAGVQVWWLQLEKLRLYSGVNQRTFFEKENHPVNGVTRLVDAKVTFTPVGFRFGKRYGLYGELTFSDGGQFTLGGFCGL